MEPAGYDRVRPLIGALDYHLPLVALFSSTSPGDVYVDDPDARGTMLARTGHRLFLAGSPDSAVVNHSLARLFAETLIPEAAAERLGGLSICTDASGWERHIGSLLPGRDVVTTQREYYELRDAQPGRPRPLPDGFSLRPADRSLLDDPDVSRLDALREEMCSERPCVEEFLERSFGVCAMFGSDLAGWCLSEYNTGPRCEIGIATLDPYKRRGVATAMATAFIEKARSRGITRIGWHCYARNLASGAAARAAGLTLVHTYPAYVVWFGE